MKVSEYKLENEVVITDENIDELSLTDIIGGDLIVGDKFIDAIVDGDTEEGGLKTVYLSSSNIGEVEIINDPEFDPLVPIADQKFKIKKY
jgi:hypothetical protein